MSAEAEATYTAGPRPFTISHDDHRGVVVVLATVFTVYAYMILGLRIAARLHTMGLDDILAILATILVTIQLALVLGATTHLFGASFAQYTGDDGSKVAKLIRASDVFFILSLFVVKAAVIWLCRRLFSINQKASLMACNVALGISALWCLASILILAIDCNDGAAIGLETGNCSGLSTRWTIVGVFDGVIELLIFSLSATVIWPLQMTLSRRLSALGCFLFRLPMLIFIGVHLHYLSKFTHSSNKGVAITEPIIFRQAESLYSLFSAAVPALNQYLRKFQTTSAAIFGYSPGTYGGHSYGLRSLSDKGNRSKGRDESVGRTPYIDISQTKDSFNPPSHRGNYSATIDHKPHKEGQSDSSQDVHSLGRHNSDEMMIRKGVSYEISHYDMDTGPVGVVQGDHNTAK